MVYCNAMKCPGCSHMEDKVIDSRPSPDGSSTRRRRECLNCGRRYTTYERIEESLPFLVKKDGSREVFDRMKVLKGIKTACEKRPVSIEVIEESVDRIERLIIEKGERELPSTIVGEEVMNELKNLDEVAYVRFASVYREFRDITEFMDELNGLLKHEKKK